MRIALYIKLAQLKSCRHCVFISSAMCRRSYWDGDWLKAWRHSDGIGQCPECACGKCATRVAQALRLVACSCCLPRCCCSGTFRRMSISVLSTDKKAPVTFSAQVVQNVYLQSTCMSSFPLRCISFMINALLCLICVWFLNIGDILHQVNVSR